MGGRRLSDVDPDTITDALLVDLWTDAAALGRARIVHGELDADHVVVADGRPWIVAFDHAEVTGDPHRSAADIAQLLASTAALVGDERAVRAAFAVLGGPPLARALPFLQPAALSGATRKLAGERRRSYGNRLDGLRATAATAIGIDPPQLVQVRRITATNAAMAVGALVAVAALLADVGDPGDVASTLGGAEWGWLALAMVVSLATNVAYALALQGTVTVRLPLIPTTEVQLGMSFSNLAVPGIGGQGMQIRFLQKLGVDLSSAVAAGGVLSSVGGLIAALGCFGVALVVEPARVDLSLIPTNGLLLVSLLVVGGGRDRQRDRGVGPRRACARGAAAATRRRDHVGRAALARAPRAPHRRQRRRHRHGDVVPRAVPARVRRPRRRSGRCSRPTSAWSRSRRSCRSPAVGPRWARSGCRRCWCRSACREIAVAGVLANQLIFYYLPAIPGWFATRDLVRRDYL